MTTQTEALKLALEALERYQVKRQDFERFADVITAIKEALAQPEHSCPECVFGVCHCKPLAQPEQVAVASVWDEGYQQGVQDERTSESNIGIAGFGAKVEPARQNPYRATPPQRKPLRDDETHPGWLVWKNSPLLSFESAFEAGVRFAEAAHGIKEKNT